MVLANYCECDLFIGENSKVGNSSFSIGSSRPETDSKVNDNTNSNHEVLDPDSLIVNTNTTTDDLDNTIAEKNSDENITGIDASPPSVIKLDNIKTGTGNDDEEQQNLSVSSSALQFPVTDAIAEGGGAGVNSNDNKKNIGQHHDCKRTDSKRRKRTVSKIFQSKVG